MEVQAAGHYSPGVQYSAPFAPPFAPGTNLQPPRWRRTESSDRFSLIIGICSFFALACIAGLVSTRCHANHRRQAAPSSRAPPETEDTKAIAAALIASLPVIVWPNPDLGGAFDRESASRTTCGICLDDYVAGEGLTLLPCKHYYHTICVNPWLLRSPQRLCPMCKRPAVEMPVEVVARDDVAPAGAAEATSAALETEQAPPPPPPTPAPAPSPAVVSDHRNRMPQLPPFLGSTSMLGTNSLVNR